jgi:alkylhydroperoxidase family enzyme
MGRLPLADPAHLDEDARSQYERFPSNLTRALLLLDRRLAKALPETANALRASELDPALREALILRVAALSDSAYERMQHLGQAINAGWSEAQLKAIEHGRFDDLHDPKTAAALRFVDQCLSGSVDDETFAAARRSIGDRGVVTAIVLVGHYMTVARLTGILGVELDEHPDSWTREH